MGIFLVFVLPVSFGVVATKTNPGLSVTRAHFVISVSVAVALFAPKIGRSIAITSRLAFFAVLPLGPVLALVAVPLTSVACRVVVTATVRSAVRPCPAKVALAGVIRSFAAVSVYALFEACFCTVLSTVAVETSFALTAVAPMSVGAYLKRK